MKGPGLAAASNILTYNAILFNTTKPPKYSNSWVNGFDSDSAKTEHCDVNEATFMQDCC